MKNFDTTIAPPVIPKSKHMVPDHLAPASRAAWRPSGFGAEMSRLRQVLLPICVAALAVNLAVCTTQAASTNPRGASPSGYVEMTQIQAAYLGSGNAGKGILRYRGRTYRFTVGGLGVGGIGISKIEAKGEVYGLERLRDFPAPTFKAAMASRWVRGAPATFCSRTGME